MEKGFTENKVSIRPYDSDLSGEAIYLNCLIDTIPSPYSE